MKQTGDASAVAHTIPARSSGSRTGRDISVFGFLIRVVAVWAALIGALFAVVYFFIVDREPKVLVYRDVNIELSDYEITPEVIEVSPSTAITFLVSNFGDAQHNLHISEDVETARLKTGESTILDAGVAYESYFVWCSVKGHRELGMEARIVVGNGG